MKGRALKYWYQLETWLLQRFQTLAVVKSKFSVEANAVYSYIFFGLALLLLADAYTLDWLMFESTTKVPLSYAFLLVAYFSLVQQRTDE